MKYLSILFLFMSFVSALANDKSGDMDTAQPGQLMMADPFILEYDGWCYFIKK